MLKLFIDQSQGPFPIQTRLGNTDFKLKFELILSNECQVSYLFSGDTLVYWGRSFNLSSDKWKVNKLTRKIKKNWSELLYLRIDIVKRIWI